MKILIIGASSFLGVNLVKHLHSLRSSLNGMRSISLVPFELTLISEHLGDVIPFDSLHTFHAIFYLKPEFNAKLHEMNSKNEFPLLAIGSGAYIDYRKGTVDYNSYVQSKHGITQMATVTIHPGFFIPNETHADTGRGLHRNTLVKLFSPNNTTVDNLPDIDLSKAYYITPVDKLLNLMTKWALNPSLYQPGWYALGSCMAVTRKELWEKRVPPADRPHIYADEMFKTAREFDISVTYEDVMFAGYSAKAWVKKHNM